MYVLALGLVLLVLKYLDVAPVAGWDWWILLAPFPLTAAWWLVADWSGHTRRRAEKVEAQRKMDRANDNRRRMGLPPAKNIKR